MQSAYNAGVGARDLLRRQLAAKQMALTEARSDIEVWEQVQILLSKAAEYARQQITSHIEAVVTAALVAVFGEGFSFRIVIGDRGGQPTAEWRVISQYGDAEVSANPEDARGGGITDVVSLALRLAMLELIRPRVEGPVLFDEPGKHVSSEFVSNMAYFLRQYAGKTGRQVILITHQKTLSEIAHVRYQVSQSNGASVVSRLD
jgi:DNA repair exonuclease SbcCD ATPase subunit